MPKLKYKFLTIILLIIGTSATATTLNGQVEQSELSGQSSLRIQRGQNNLRGQAEDNLLQASASETMPPIAPPRRLYPLYPVAASNYSDTMSPMVVRFVGQQLRPTSDNNRNYSFNDNHGEAPMGCLGAEVVTGNWLQPPTIITILPGSDLNNFDIQVGDQITNVDGHHLIDGHDLERRSVGVPGTIMNLTISRNGVKRVFSVKRIDARTVAQYDPHFQDVANMTRSW